MRTWVIKYWTEVNDTSTDFEEEVLANTEEEALKIFKEQRRRYRIESIIEEVKTEAQYNNLRNYRNSLRDKFESVKTGLLESGKILKQIKEIDIKLGKYEKKHERINK